MEKEFDKIIDSMPALFTRLESMDLIDRLQARKLLPKKGVYVFYENGKPIYVGRSQNIPNRVLNHGRPSSGHNSATFAFLLAKEEYRKKQNNKKLTRNALEQDPVFDKIYREQKERVFKMKIKAVEIESHEAEAIFEIYAAMRLKTKYNVFPTH